MLFFISPAGAVAKYCNQYVCVCVCLCVCEDISGITCTIFTKCFVHVSYGRGLVLLWHHCDTLCASGLWMTSRFLQWPYSGVNLATKD